MSLWYCQFSFGVTPTNTILQFTGMIVTGLFSRHKSAHFGEHVSDTHECEHQCECVPALVSFQATLHSHTPATLQPRDVNMLWASVSVSVSNFGSKEGGTLNLLLTLFRRKGLDCRSLWAFDKLQLMSSWMSFSDFDCADNILWWRERGKIHWLRKEELKQTVDSGDSPASQINIKLQW